MCNESFTPAHITLNIVENLKKVFAVICLLLVNPPFQKKSVCLYRNWKKCGFAADPPPQKCVEMASQARVKGADVAGP